MKLFTASQIKAWDQETIRQKNIKSIDLMEHAAVACFRWMTLNLFNKSPVSIFCGKGNNGGDGLALARYLLQDNNHVQVYILETGKTGSTDFQTNLHRLRSLGLNIHYIEDERFFPTLQSNEIIVDALFGTGLNKPLNQIAASLIAHINSYNATIISIDIPSGLFADAMISGKDIIKASHTLTFQTIKQSFLFEEYTPYLGQVEILDIGLSKEFEENEFSNFVWMDLKLIQSFLKKRLAFSHKGTYGHAAICAGSNGMMGAAVLSAKACLASGVGKLTCIIPACGYTIIQSVVPEAMCKVLGQEQLSGSIPYESFQAIAVGPGLGTHYETIPSISSLLENSTCPLILDADALNIISMNPDLKDKIPEGSVLTPHPGEFNRLAGACNTSIEQLQKAIEFAKTYKIYLVLKGHYTRVITPNGTVYFNSTGNSGMAKGGMGDVLTGLIVGLVSSGYPLPEAAMLGVYLHGLAGDLTADKLLQESMQASDLIRFISKGWKLIKLRI